MKKSILIFLFALLGILSAHAYDFEVDGIYYDIISGTDQVEVTYKEYLTDSYSGLVVIPSTVIYNGDTYMVTTIGYSAFYGCRGLTSVTIPESVTTIGTRAFKGCSGLTTVTIPESVTSIGEYAFSGCTGLTSVTIGEGVTSIEFYAFSGCTSISIPLYNSKVFAYMPENYKGEYAIPSGIQSIEESAFMDCKGLTSVTIPNSVTSIGRYAFGNCSGLTSVTIGEGVTSIGPSAFGGCSGLTSVEWNARDCEDIDYAITPFLFFNSDDTENKSLAFITFGSEVEHIPAYLCSYCSGLRSVTIGENVTSIGRSAFKGCSGLTTLTIPESVTSIGESAFSDCSGLTSVTIPEGVTTIEERTFYYCSGLRSVTMGEGVTSIRYEAFSGCSGLGSVTIPNSVDTIGSYAFADCMGLASVIIGKGVTTIHGYAFSNCSNLKTVTSLNRIPPYCTRENVFGDENKPSAVYYYSTLYVPRGRKAAYEVEQEWKKFFDIKEIETTYMVTVNVNDASMGAVIGGGDYGLGEQVMLAAIPNTGYHFVKWDDENTDNPRLLTVTGDITLTAIFAKDKPDNPDNPDTPTANENTDADNFRVYVQNRTICLSENRGIVRVFNTKGQCIYNGASTRISVPNSGVYVVRVGTRSYKVVIG